MIWVQGCRPGRLRRQPFSVQGRSGHSTRSRPAEVPVSGAHRQASVSAYASIIRASGYAILESTGGAAVRSVVPI
jgi:hypothetical protein